MSKYASSNTMVEISVFDLRPVPSTYFRLYFGVYFRLYFQFDGIPENTPQNTVEKCSKVGVFWETFQLYFQVYFQIRINKLADHQLANDVCSKHLINFKNQKLEFRLRKLGNN